MAVAVSTFLVALALIATERLDRTKTALLGAAMVVLFVGEFSQEEAIESVDFNTIGLLVGMMILVYVTQQSGVYDYIAVRAGQLSKGRPFAVVMSMALTLAPMPMPAATPTASAMTFFTAPPSSTPTTSVLV